jgi:type IV secretory pathway VirB4 component
MPKEQSVATQQFVDIAEIKNGIIFLKNGGLRRVLMVSGINFDLKSEEEQNIILYAFQNFLNTLDFSMQFVIHSRKMNIDAYIESLKNKEEQEENELLRNQISEYAEFVKSFVEQNAVMAKTFFAVVPYDPIQIAGAAADIISGLKFWEKKKTKKEEEGAEQKMTQMNQRVEQVISGLNQIGLRAIILNNEELIELFYNYYNPAKIERKKIKIAEE